MEQEGGLIAQIHAALEAELAKDPNPRASSSAAARIALLRSLLAKAERRAVALSVPVIHC